MNIIRDKLKALHEAENKLNKDMSTVDYKIKKLQKEKDKIKKMVSHNMKYRNRIINQL